MKILFILKINDCYSFYSYTRRSSGLWNSVNFTVEALSAQGIDAKIVEVVDNNSIDAEVAAFNPDVVVIEALWVVPSKFPVLQKLHPTVKWFVHLHSHVPFLSSEGVAIEWLYGYAALGVGIIANSDPLYRALLAIFTPTELTYLPNVYTGTMMTSKANAGANSLNIGCFGAVRPLKNQLLQALAAIRYAKETNRVLIFHVNGTRTEMNGDPILKNIQALFTNTTNTMLTLHPWMEHDAFIALLNTTIDIGMQVSLTETFNVVAADYVTAGIPMVVSKEVQWASSLSKAQDDSIDAMVDKLYSAQGNRLVISWNQKLLGWKSSKAQKLWLKFCQTV